MILTATIQQRPEPGARSDSDMPIDTITGTGEDYDAAHADVLANLPAGWRVLSLQRW